MVNLRLLLPCLVTLAGCLPAAGPDPVSTRDLLAIRMTGNDGAATGQVWDIRVTGDDAFTCQMTNPSPMTGQVPAAVTGIAPGLFDDLAALVAEPPSRPEISIFTGTGTIATGGQPATIPATLFSDETSAGEISTMIYSAAAPFGTCFLWG